MKRMILGSSAALIVSIAAVWGLGRYQEKKSGSPAVAVETEPEYLSDESLSVRQILSEIVAHPGSRLHTQVAKRLPLLRRKVEQAKTRQERGKARIALARTLLLAGELEETMSLLDALVVEIPKGNPARLDALELLGTAHLRQGELDNCLELHDKDSCIVPIAPAGQHTKRAGSTRAAEIFSEILNEDDSRLGIRWLLNVAQMTLGQYPEGVPPKWRVAESRLRSDYDIKEFDDIASRLGVDVREISGGAAVDDFNNDGYLDIVASSMGLEDQLRLFISNRDGTFSETTERAGLTGLYGGLNLIHADYNNDGALDIFVMRGAWGDSDGRHPNSLLKGNGDGTFVDVTREAGVLDFAPTLSAAFGDFDGDGWLDLFVGHESHRAQFPCRLYRNNGDGTFSNQAEELGVAVTSRVKGVTWGDIDNDGDLDLYVSSLRSENYLFENQGAGKPFLNISQQLESANVWDSFPAWFWDYDNDGFLDLTVLGYGSRKGRRNDRFREFFEFDNEAPTQLLHNVGGGVFEDVSAKVGIKWDMLAMGANFGDLDNDGWLDFYVGTGSPDFRDIVPNRMFRNVDGERFDDVTFSGGFGHIQKGHGISFADLDNDGDQDIYAVMGGAFPTDVFQNSLYLNPGHGNHWVTLRLVGVKSNRSGIGSRVAVSVDGPEGPRTLHRLVSSGGSFGANSLQLEVGLGTANEIRRIEILWHGSKERQVLSGLPVDAIYRVLEGGEAVALDLPPMNFEKASIPASHHHHHHHHHEH